MFSRSKKKNTVGVIYDIGSASIGASIVVYSVSKPSTIIYETRVPIWAEDEPDAQALLDRISKATALVTERILNEGFRKKSFLKLEDTGIRRADVMFASPWFVSETKTVTLEKEEKITISESFVEQLLEKENDTFVSSLKKNELFSKKNASTIEKSIIKIYLNGYETPTPYGKKARRIDLFLNFGIVPSGLKKYMTELIKKNFNVDSVISHTFPVVTHGVLEIAMPDVKSYLLVDVTGEVTSVSLVEEGILLDTTTFAKGLNSFGRAVANRFHISQTLARPYLSLYANGHADRETKEKIEEVFNKEGDSWVEYFKKSLSNLNEKGDLPSRIYITADEPVSGLIKRKIKDNDFDIKFNPTIFSEDLLGSYYQNKSEQNKSDVFLSLGAIYINTLIFSR